MRIMPAVSAENPWILARRRGTAGLSRRQQGFESLGDDNKIKPLAAPPPASHCREWRLGGAVFSWRPRTAPRGLCYLLSLPDQARGEAGIFVRRAHRRAYAFAGDTVCGQRRPLRSWSPCPLA